MYEIFEENSYDDSYITEKIFNLQVKFKLVNFAT